MTVPRFIKLTSWDNLNKAPGKPIWINPEKIFSISQWTRAWSIKPEPDKPVDPALLDRYGNIVETVLLTNVYASGGGTNEDHLSEVVIETPEEILLAIGLPNGLRDITDEIIGYCIQAPSGDLNAVLSLATSNRLYAGPND